MMPALVASFPMTGNTWSDTRWRRWPQKKVPTKVPVVIGVNWYVEFDNPEVDNGNGDYFVARDGKLTDIRGGHCVCLEPGGEPDPDEWWDFYDQGREGACVGF